MVIERLADCDVGGVWDYCGGFGIVYVEGVEVPEEAGWEGQEEQEGQEDEVGSEGTWVL